MKREDLEKTFNRQLNDALGVAKIMAMTNEKDASVYLVGYMSGVTRSIQWLSDNIAYEHITEEDLAKFDEKIAEALKILYDSTREA